MRWLWLVSVGASDLQYPAWSQDESGAWTQRHRFEVGRDGLRAIHETLLSLASTPGCVVLSADDVRPIRLGRGPSLAVENELIDGQWVHSVRLDSPRPEDRATALRISATGEEIPNAFDARLTVLFPKVAPMIRAVREAIGRDKLCAVVLNTCRTRGADAPREPVAAGPLTARFLAQELNLQCTQGGTATPVPLLAGSSTWLDVLQDAERFEDPEVEVAVQRRLNALLDAFDAQPGDRVVVTTSGGLPPLKPLIERIPAARLGSNRVSILDNPEGGRRGDPQLHPLAERWLDRATLRLHCVEALRQQDYAAAYGLASRRAVSESWAHAVAACTAPLLDLPSVVLPDHRIAGLEPYQLRALRLEASLAMREVPTAIRHLSMFIESALWTLLRRSRFLYDRGYHVEEDGDGIYGPDELPSDMGEFFVPRRNSPGRFAPMQARVFEALPLWVEQHEEQPELKDCLHLLRGLSVPYWRRDMTQSSIHDLRNQLSHGAGSAPDLQAAEQRLSASGVVAGTGLEFGRNFLDHPPASQLLFRMLEDPHRNGIEQARRALHEAVETAARGER